MKLKSICCYGKFVAAGDGGRELRLEIYGGTEGESAEQPGIPGRSFTAPQRRKELAKISNITPLWLSGDNYTSSNDMRRGWKL
jgi:hypothetical protein